MAAENRFRPSIAYLSVDVLVNHIFVRLPVRSLLRCRCVCKKWYRLQTEPYFITMHLKFQKFHDHQKILCGPVFYKEGLPGDSTEDYRSKLGAFKGVFYSLELKSSSSVTADAVRLPGFPIHLKNYHFIQTMGYCNGMVCMEVRSKMEKEYSKSRRLLIGNPSTGDYRILPEPTSAPLLVGFGCDSSVDDYKCVWVDNVTRNPRIFSLKLDSWRTNFASSDNYAIKQGEVDCQNVGVALDRSIYWLVQVNNMIVEFDLRNEDFRQLPLPSDRPYDISNIELSMKVLGGSLCLINDRFLEGNRVIHMWLMSKQEENNNKEKCCWSKLMTVTFPTSDWGIFGMHPLSFMKDGKILCSMGDVASENFFVLVDPKTKRIEEFTTRDENGGDWLEQLTFQAPHMAYIDTLVSPN